MRTSSSLIAALALTATAFVIPSYAQTDPATPGSPPVTLSPKADATMNGGAMQAPAASAEKSDAMQNSTAAVSEDTDMIGSRRASKMIGMDVVNDKDQTIGKIDDIVIGSGDKATTAVISGGGGRGSGAKRGAVPFDERRPASNDHKSLTLPNASKEALKAMPEFKFGLAA